jgi:hypothetical protein
MNKGRTFIAALFGAALLASGTAIAVPTASVDGITFPVGIIPGGNQIDSSFLGETLITAVGQTLSGVGKVNAIATPGFASTVWADGQNGVELAFVFNNFVNQTLTATNSTFTGGTINFYVLPAGTQVSGLGSLAADTTAIQAGQLFLSLAAAATDASGTTLSAVSLAGTFTGTFTAFGQALLNVTGGDAATFFDTNTFANPFGGFGDVTLTSDFSNGGCTGEFAVCGSGTVKANAVPEPLSLGVLGLGMVALGFARRQRG